MIAHVVLYRFPPVMPTGDRERFLADLASATSATGTVDRFTAGRHRPLPVADAVAPRWLFSVAARWEFTDMAAMHRFSQHPAVTDVIDRWVVDAGIEVAFANTEDEWEVGPS